MLVQNWTEFSPETHKQHGRGAHHNDAPSGESDALWRRHHCHQQELSVKAFARFTPSLLHSPPPRRLRNVTARRRPDAAQSATTAPEACFRARDAQHRPPGSTTKMTPTQQYHRGERERSPAVAAACPCRPQSAPPGRSPPGSAAACPNMPQAPAPSQPWPGPAAAVTTHVFN